MHVEPEYLSNLAETLVARPECCLFLPKVIDPYRRIGKNHFAFALRSGIEAMFGAPRPD